MVNEEAPRISRNAMPETPVIRPQEDAWRGWRQVGALLLVLAGAGGALWLWATHNTFWSGVAAVALTVMACRALRGGCDERDTY